MKHKVAIVTGESSGIGRCTAVALREAGCTVYGFSRRQIPLDGVMHMDVDVTREESIASALDEVMKAEGRVDILVNCAGNGIAGAVEFTQQKDAKAQFEVNFFGMVNMNKAVLPILREQGSGRIVNISSVAAVAHIPFQTFYSASKAAVESYTCCLANEVRPFKITVVCVQPGDICTGFTEARRSSYEGDDVYGGRIARSVSGMEKDERNGMKPEVAGKYIAKTALRSHSRPICTLGLGYQFLSLLCKLLPCRLRNWIVGLLYAR
ncbi:MAG: SDR family oxidoreductase [Oscillospiraceae bacterium]|nr:SDR family oxidoreductase [Oscillospiraceae bacterium]